jgi:iron complex outermembrane receptor protein
MYGAGISLRGVADEGGGGLAVAPHLNGVYLGRATLALARQFDVERVEVVKGPQGTLYGRNATGGSLNVITRTAEPRFGAALEGAWGSFSTARLHGHVNLPGEKLATRIAFAGAQGDGFIRNSIDGRRFAGEDFNAFRASVHARPGEALTIEAMLQRVEDDGASGELWSPRRDRLPDPRDIHLTTVTLANPYHSTTNDFASVNLSYEFDGPAFRSITGYARNVTRDLDDCAGVAELPGCVRGVRPLRYEQYSQEFRLESRSGDSFDWLLGAYYFDSVASQNFHLTLASPPAPIFNYTEVSDETAHAVFGDATYTLGSSWHVNGGLRVSSEKNRTSDSGTGIADYPTPLAAEGSWDSTSWRLGVDFSPSAWMFLYANVSTGFKSGGITTDLLPDGEFDDYDPEEIIAYELGMTATLWDGRSTLRASAFAYDFEDMQVTTTAVIEGVPRTVVDNAAAARIDGVDVSASTQIGGRLTFTGMFVWLPRREFVEFIDARGNALSGNKISRASEWSASASIGYRQPIAGHGELGADVDYNYRSEFFFTKENIPVQYQGGFGLLNLNLRYDSSRRGWYVFASARNLLDADYFTQVFLQSAPGYPARYEVGFGWRH